MSSRKCPSCEGKGYRVTYEGNSDCPDCLDHPGRTRPHTGQRPEYRLYGTWPKGQGFAKPDPKAELLVNFEQAPKGVAQANIELPGPYDGPMGIFEDYGKDG